MGDNPGDRLRQARIDKGMSIRDLAMASGLTTVTISNLEAGRTTASLLTLRKVTQVLGVPVIYFGYFESLPEDTLGQRIKKARLNHGLMLKELSAIVGVDEKSLCHWEMDRHVPLKRHLDKLLVIIPGLCREGEFWV
jgi:transcriptional regulator with XRE-family HTH domain